MALASDIIQAAYRESNLIAIVATPNTNETNEALGRLNGLILSTIGNEAGEELRDLNIGGSFDQSSYCSQWVPANARLILNLTAAVSYNLHPEPYEGQRLAMVDVGGNLATRNLTLTGNGRKIEGGASLVLSTNGMDRQWMFRADVANWVKLTSLASSDAMPFPTEFDDYFIVSLALRLNPRHGAALSQESQAALAQQKTQIRARYRRPRPTQDTGSLGLLGQRGNAFNPSTADFNAGRPRW